MAKAKLLPVASPTYKSVVGVPIPGARQPFDIEFTFKWRTRDDVREWLDSNEGKSNVTILLDMVTGWDLDDPFNEENLNRLDQDFPGATSAVLSGYLGSLSGAKAGNSGR